MKKLLALALALVLVLSLSASALAAESSTSVNVTVNTSQLSVTVPTTLVIDAKVDGGTATVPTTYKITNGSSIPVKVDTIAVALKEGAPWKFKNVPIEAKAAPAGTDNEIYLSVNGQVLAVQGASAPTTLSSWNIAANNELVLPLVCSTSKISTTSTFDGLITITYVISAGSHNAGT